jgi:hypothetical protein
MGNLSNYYQVDHIITLIIKKIVNDYHSKCCISVMVDFLWTTGSSSQLLTPPLHLIIVNQQIFVKKNVTWIMLVSTYLSINFCYIKFKDYYLQSSIFKLKILE